MAQEIQHYQHLLRRVEAACKRSGRNSRDITILAATKYADIEQINRVIAAGIRVIGENRIQDAVKKFPLLLPVRKHFIGHLQTNKVKMAVRWFDVIESVDRMDVAEKIDHEASKMQKIMPVLVEVNVANDPAKYGVSAGKALDFMRSLRSFSFLDVRGLMTIAPFHEDVEAVRPYFRTMKTLFDFCRKEFPSMQILSMGMSHDFEVAIEEGATEIRLGSTLFQ